jgi:hypothetical protein
MAIQVNYSGGKIYFERIKSDGTYEAELEIGLIQSFEINTEKSEIELKSYANGVGASYAKDTTELLFSATLEVADTSPDIMALALFGEKENRTYAIGETLPNGTVVAGADVTLDLVKAGTVTSVSGRLKFVGVAVRGSNSIILHKNVNLSLSGGVAILTTDDYRKLTFDVAILVDPNSPAGESPFLEIYDMDSLA